MKLLLVFHLALRNVISHRGKSAVIAVVLALDAVLLVVGGSLLTSMTDRMRQNVTNSLAGDIHLFSTAATSMDIFAAEGLVDTLPAIDDYAGIAERIRAHPNVAAVVPMTTGAAVARVGNRLDRLFERARAAARSGEQGRLRELAREIDAVLERLRDELETGSTEAPELAIWRAALERTTADAFWQSFLEKPLDALEVLENEVAPIGGEPASVAIRYVATDPAAFAGAFSRFELVNGEMLTAGSDGLILSESFYERSFKHPVAYALDVLEREVANGGMGPRLVAARLEQLGSQAASVVRALRAGGEQRVRSALTTLLGSASSEAPLHELVARFFAFPPESLGERRRWFYEHIAPELELYSIAIGDRLTLQATSRHGHPVAVNARLLGLCRFRGLEEFRLAAAFAFADPALHSQLRGGDDDGLAAELEALRRSTGVSDVARTSVEDSLFADAAAIETVATVQGSIDVRLERDAPRTATASLDAIEHAAIVLRDPQRLRQTIAELRAQAGEHDWELRIVPWDAAAGVVAQYFGLVRLQLYIGLAIAWLIAMLIVNVAIVVVTLQRTREFGTLRAMGASSSIILALVLVETLVIALAAVTIGTAAGAAAIAWLGERGLPAVGPALRLLFGGDRLYPSLALAYVAGAVVTTCAVGALAALYPARLATRVPPVLALREAA